MFLPRKAGRTLLVLGALALPTASSAEIVLSADCLDSGVDCSRDREAPAPLTQMAATETAPVIRQVADVPLVLGNDDLALSTDELDRKERGEAIETAAAEPTLDGAAEPADEIAPAPWDEPVAEEGEVWSSTEEPVVAEAEPEGAAVAEAEPVDTAVEDAAAEELPVVATDPVADEPVAEEPAVDEAASHPTDFGGCMEQSIRRGNAFGESQRVCRAVFPE